MVYVDMVLYIVQIYTAWNYINNNYSNTAEIFSCNVDLPILMGFLLEGGSCSSAIFLVTRRVDALEVVHLAGANPEREGRGTGIDERDRSRREQ